MVCKANPNIKGPAPIFMPPKRESSASASASTSANNAESAGHGKGKGGRGDAKGGKRGKGGRKAGGRLQHDNIFDLDEAALGDMGDGLGWV